MGLVLVLDRKGERQLNIPGCRDIQREREREILHRLGGLLDLCEGDNISESHEIYVVI